MQPGCAIDLGILFPLIGLDKSARLSALCFSDNLLEYSTKWIKNYFLDTYLDVFCSLVRMFLFAVHKYNIICL